MNLTNIYLCIYNNFLYISSEIRKFIKPFLILFSIYLIGYLAIIRANFAYIDDLGRVLSGYKGWENFSRFTSNFLSSFIHTSNYLTDISPLTQIIAIVFLSLAGLIILHVLTGKYSFTITEYTSVLIIGFTPYFLECISYKFDSPYMALSILAAVIPLLFYKKNNILYFILSIASILIVSTTYQAGSGIYPMFVVLLCLVMWGENKEIKDILIFIFISIIAYIIGLAIFKLFIMVPITTYVSNDLPSIQNIVPSTILNLKEYFSYILNDFKQSWLIIIGFLYMCFIVVFTYNSKRNRIKSFLLAIIGLTILTCLSFGIYPILKSPLFSPRAMYGFGVTLSLISIYIVMNTKNIIGKVFVFILFWFFFVHAFIYGNALIQQEEYANFRMKIVINDLIENDLLSNDSTKRLRIIGSIGYAPSLQNLPQITYRLIPINFGDSVWVWAYTEFISYHGLKGIVVDNEIKKDDEKLIIIEDNIFHTIKANDDSILIELYK